MVGDIQEEKDLELQKFILSEWLGACEILINKGSSFAPTFTFAKATARAASIFGRYFDATPASADYLASRANTVAEAVQFFRVKAPSVEQGDTLEKIFLGISESEGRTVNQKLCDTIDFLMSACEAFEARYEKFNPDNRHPLPLTVSERRIRIGKNVRERLMERRHESGLAELTSK